MEKSWKTSFETISEIEKYGDNALALYALLLKFNLDDIETVAENSITDGSDDKKIDLVYINQEDEYAVICQCYRSVKNKKAAPANKASDLNTGLAWLLQRDIEDVPDRLKSVASELRELIINSKIKDIHIWYVHNLPESKNAASELVSVQQTAKTLANDLTKNINLNVSAAEIGSDTLQDWYERTETTILVNDEQEFSIEGGYSISGPGWEAFSTAIPAKTIYELYKKYQKDLFSANLRNYLGSRASDSNINNGIQKTIQEDPKSFWIFNNGLTAITNEYEHMPAQNKIQVKGISIVNGAQTTGSIGSIKSIPDESARVPIRFIKTNKQDKELVQNIIEKNNRQNKVEASDFRSNDAIQKRLASEFKDFACFGYDSKKQQSVRNNKNKKVHIQSSVAGQALACYLLEPRIAYNQKTAIWVQDKLYSKFFNDYTKAENIIFAYSLFKSVHSIKYKLREIIDPTDEQRKYLDFFSERGSIYLMASTVSAALEIVMGKSIPSKIKLHFKDKDINIDQAKANWEDIVYAVLPFCDKLKSSLSGGIKSKEVIENSINDVLSLLESTKSFNSEKYKKFEEKVTLRQ